MKRDIFRDELCDEIGFSHFLNVEDDFAACDFLDVIAQFVEVCAALADDDAWTCGKDFDADAVAGALNKDAGNGGLAELFMEEFADAEIFLYEDGEVFLVRIPAGFPVAADGETEAGWIYFLAHDGVVIVFFLKWRFRPARHGCGWCFCGWDARCLLLKGGSGVTRALYPRGR